MSDLARMKRAAEMVRDETTEEGNWPLIYPMAMDVLASSPALMLRLINALRTPPSHGLGMGGQNG